MGEDNALHAQVSAALNDLAARLGGAADDGGPIENLTQVQDREDLGMLLTDKHDRVLGRVWVEFGAPRVVLGTAAGAEGLSSNEAGVGVDAHVRSEVVQPPQSLTDWVAQQPGRND